MPYTLKKLPDAPIVVYDQDTNYDPNQGIAETLDHIARVLDTQQTPVFMIYNVGGVRIELDDLIQASSKGARGSNAVLHHHNVRENVCVFSSSLVRMAIKGLESATFGQAKVVMFETLDEALAYCRGKLDEER